MPVQDADLHVLSPDARDLAASPGQAGSERAHYPAWRREHLLRGRGRADLWDSRPPPLLSLEAFEGREGSLQDTLAARHLPSVPGRPRNTSLNDRSTRCQSTLAPAPSQPAFIALVVSVPASYKILFLDWLTAFPPLRPLCVRSLRLGNRVAKLRTRLHYWRLRARPRWLGEGESLLQQAQLVQTQQIKARGGSSRLTRALSIWRRHQSLPRFRRPSRSLSLSSLPTSERIRIPARST